MPAFTLGKNRHRVSRLLRACKPDPVVGYHLSVPPIAQRNQSAYPLSSGGPPSGDSIRGISACKVYPLPVLPPAAVSSYLTFSPLFRLAAKRLFSVALSVSACGETRLFTGALPCTVRTFLPGDKPGPITCPATIFFQFTCKMTDAFSRVQLFATKAERNSHLDDAIFKIRIYITCIKVTNL